MRFLVRMLVLGLVVAVGVPAMASTPTDRLATCLVDTLNGKERKTLAKWIFFAIAAHPEIEAYSSATAEDTEATDKYIGELITRLLTSDCPKEFKAASE